jgi:hypothetical protein
MGHFFARGLHRGLHRSSLAVHIRRSLEAPVDVAPVRDPDDDDATALVVDLVDDPPVADADAVVVAAGELRGAALSRLSCQALDRGGDATQDVR